MEEKKKNGNVYREKFEKDLVERLSAVSVSTHRPKSHAIIHAECSAENDDYSNYNDGHNNNNNSISVGDDDDAVKNDNKNEKTVLAPPHTTFATSNTTQQ